MKIRLISLLILIATFTGCSPVTKKSEDVIHLISWGGIAADKADTLYTLAKECGFDIHLGLYSTQKNAMLSMDAAERAGIGIIISFPQIKDSTEKAITPIKDHPALIAYHVKDEPELDDFEWIQTLQNKISSLDPNHPCYINLLPNWAWGVEEYCENLESFASQMDVPFYSFDNYPVIEVNGKIEVRSDWYRNLEEFSQMSRRHGKPFWAFALAKAHSITAPWPDTVYPEPTLGQLRLQVFSNLLYGAQAIQYFNFTGLVDPATCQKKPVYDLVKQVNSEVKAFSHVFTDCSILGVWHLGDLIPSGTHPLTAMPYKNVSHMSITGEGAVVSLIDKAGETYLAIQNRSCFETATLDIEFNSRVKIITPDGLIRFDGNPITLSPGNLVVFKL